MRTSAGVCVCDCQVPQLASVHSMHVPACAIWICCLSLARKIHGCWQCCPYSSWWHFLRILLSYFFHNNEQSGCNVAGANKNMTTRYCRYYFLCWKSGQNGEPSWITLAGETHRNTGRVQLLDSNTPTNNMALGVSWALLRWVLQMASYQSIGIWTNHRLLDGWLCPIEHEGDQRKPSENTCCAQQLFPSMAWHPAIMVTHIWTDAQNVKLLERFLTKSWHLSTSGCLCITCQATTNQQPWTVDQMTIPIVVSGGRFSCHGRSQPALEPCVMQGWNHRRYKDSGRSSENQGWQLAADN